ncbi:hypothetical protein OROHE_017475 [Orobanche hederae]
MMPPPKIYVYPPKIVLKAPPTLLLAPRKQSLETPITFQSSILQKPTILSHLSSKNPLLINLKTLQMEESGMKWPVKSLLLKVFLQIPCPMRILSPDRDLKRRLRLLLLYLGRFLFPMASVTAVVVGSDIPRSGKPQNDTLAVKASTVSAGKSSTAPGSGPETTSQGVDSASPMETSKVVDGSFPKKPLAAPILKGHTTSVAIPSSPPVSGSKNISQIIGQNQKVVSVVSADVKGVVIPPADLRGTVSSETWARFPESIWKDAAVIVAEIL